VPLALTVRHVIDFGGERQLVGGDLARPEAWDALRSHPSLGFTFAADRAEWEQAARLPEIQARARALAPSIEGVGSLASYGTGGSPFESVLQRLSQRPLRLTLTDFAPETVAYMRRLIPEAQVRRHDLSREGPLEADLQLFHRIDTEFDNATWQEIFRRFAAERVLFVAGVCDLRLLAGQLSIRLRHPRRVTYAGWARNRAALEALWRLTHRARSLELPAGPVEGWMLEPL